MAEVLPKDVLFRAGGATLKRLQTLVSAGASRVEVAHTFTRADATTCATSTDRDVILRGAVANALRLEWPSGLVDATGNAIGGPLVEGTRTSPLLWGRDMSNAAWTKTGTTAVRNQTGPDGVPNSATLVTATGNNGFVFQSFVLASSARAPSAWVKRVTGSGSLFMSTDSGSLYVDVTSQVTTNWGRVTIPTQTLANPGPAFKLGTSGDAVAIDYFQNENGTFASSAIPVTTTAVTRAADSLTSQFNWGPQDVTILVRLGRPRHADNAGALGISPGIFSFGAGAAARIGAYFDPAARNIVGVIDTATTDQTVSAAIPAGNPVVSFQFKNLTTGGQVAIDTGSGLSAFSSAATAFSAFSSQTVRIGRYDDELYGVLGDMVVARGLRTRAEMLAIDT